MVHALSFEVGQPFIFGRGPEFHGVITKMTKTGFTVKCENGQTKWVVLSGLGEKTTERKPKRAKTTKGDS